MAQDGEAPKHGPGRQYFVPAPDVPTKDPEPRSGSSSTRQPRTRPHGAHGSGGSPKPNQQTRAKPTSRQPQQSSPAQRAQPTRKAQPAQEARPNRHRLRTARRIVFGVIVVIAIVAGFFAYRAVSTFNAIERVDLADVLTPATGDAVNYLLVGSDSRDELDPEGSSGVTGSRADTLIVLRVSPTGSQMMSIPRDLWVTIADTGNGGRINGSFNRGPANLVATVTSNLDIPINHYVEVGFGSFAGLVDALGGVPINFEHPAFDKNSGLDITEPGVHVLNGEQALAYARSRHFTEVIDGRPVKDPTADLGRQERQQEFLRAALGALGESKNPLDLLAAGDAMSGELKVDKGLGLRDMYSLARRLGGASPESVVLPTVPTRKGRAAVLALKEPDAAEVLAGFR